MATESGTAETDLSLAQQQALADAISSLEPHEAHPAIGALVEKLKGAEPDELEKIEKAMLDMSTLRVELAKSGSPNPLAVQRVEKAHRSLEMAYLQRVSGAYQGEHGEQLHRLQKVEAGRGWKDRLDGGTAA